MHTASEQPAAFASGLSLPARPSRAPVVAPAARPRVSTVIARTPASGRRARARARNRQDLQTTVAAPAQFKKLSVHQQQLQTNRQKTALSGGGAADVMEKHKGASIFDHDPVDGCPSLEKCPALVLNADFQPLSYLPLSLWPWQEAVKAVYSDRVNIVATYDIMVRSPSVIFPLPSVISLKHYQKSTHKPPFSRFNLFLRDQFSCQYCSIRLPTTELTFDHVVPRCLGGKTTWTNVVAACCNCNHKKGRRLLKDVPDLNLVCKPLEPTAMSLQSAARLFPPRGQLHESWRDYMYWNESMADDL
jgi:5-methylcytosine-specific restriction endonuclease McrA